MTDEECPDCSGKLGLLTELTGRTVFFCMGDCYEKKPGLEVSMEATE